MNVSRWLVGLVVFVALASGVAGCSLDFAQFEKSHSRTKNDAGDDASIDVDASSPSDPCEGHAANDTLCDGDTLHTCGSDGGSSDALSCSPGTCQETAGAAACACPTGTLRTQQGGCKTAMDGGTGDTNQAPSVEISFPPTGTVDTATIGVRGRVSDAEGDTVSRLTINGAPAKLAKDGSFSVIAPLALGAHALAIHVEDDGGAKADTQGATLERLSYLFEEVGDMVLDAAHERVIVVDLATDAVVSIALKDGTRTVIAARSKTPARRNCLVLDAAHNRVLVGERAPFAIAWIDLTTGKRSLVADATHGSGDVLAPLAVTLDPSNATRALVVSGDEIKSNSATASAFYFVDLTSGARTALPTGATPVAGVQRAVFTPDGATLYVSCSDGLQAITIATGAVTLISAGNGGVYGFGKNLALDGNRVLIAGFFGVTTVDLTTHTTLLLAATDTGSDPQPVSIDDAVPSFAYDAKTKRALMIGSIGNLLSVRLQPGDAVPLSNKLYGKGPSLMDVTALSPYNGDWIVFDRLVDAVISIDSGTGDRTIVSGGIDNVGSGPAFNTVFAGTSDTNGSAITVGKALVLDVTHILTVDLKTGARTVIASDEVGNVIGSGPMFQGATKITLDPNSAHAIVTVNDTLLSIALDTGDRTLLGSASAQPFADVIRGGDNLYALTTDALYLVDVTSGARTLISASTLGTGPNINNAQSLGLLDNNTAVIINESVTDHSLLEVNLGTGDRKDISLRDDEVGNYLSALAGDASSSALIVARDNELLRVDLADKSRTTISDRTVQPWLASGMAFDASSGLLYFMETEAGSPGERLTTLAPRSGSRHIVSTTKQALTDDTAVFNLALDDADKKGFFVTGRQLVSVDLETGKQTLVSSGETNPVVGMGIDFPDITGMCWDPKAKRPLLNALGLPAMITIDPKTGDRSVLSGGPTGKGPAFSLPIAIGLDVAHQRLLVADGSQIVPHAALFGADLETGDRVVLASETIGSGPLLVSPMKMTIDDRLNRALLLDLGDATNPAAIVALSLDKAVRTRLISLEPHLYQHDSVYFTGPPTELDAEAQVMYLFTYRQGLMALDLTNGTLVLIAGNR